MSSTKFAVHYGGVLVHSGKLVNGLGQMMHSPSAHALSQHRALTPHNALQTGITFNQTKRDVHKSTLDLVWVSQRPPEAQKFDAVTPNRAPVS